MNDKPDIDDLADLTEPFADEGTKYLLRGFAGELMPEILENVPVIKTGVVISKLFNTAKATIRAKMMYSFLHALQTNDKTMQEFEKLPAEDRAYIRGLVISQLDMHTDERQAEALALLVDAYLWRQIDRLTFVGIVSEIKTANPLLFYFDVDAVTFEVKNNGSVEARGATHLLPAAFGHNTVTGIGQWSSTGEYKFVVTPLGKSFYDHVYTPMLRLHTK